MVDIEIGLTIQKIELSGKNLECSDLRAGLFVTTKEHGLPSVVTKTVSFETRNISTFLIIGFDTSLKILQLELSTELKIRTKNGFSFRPILAGLKLWTFDPDYPNFGSRIWVPRKLTCIHHLVRRKIQLIAQNLHVHRRQCKYILYRPVWHKFHSPAKQLNIRGISDFFFFFP